MFKCTLDFGDHMLSCGDADETWKQLPILQDAHFLKILHVVRKSVGFLCAIHMGLQTYTLRSTRTMI